MLRTPRAVVLFGIGLASVATAPPAKGKGWEEVHQTSDDVRVAVAADGVATITHRLRYRIVAGRFKSFDFDGLDPRAVIAAETKVIPEHGEEIAARVEASPKAPGSIRIVFDEQAATSVGASAASAAEAGAGATSVGAPTRGRGRERGRRDGGGLRRGTYLVDVAYKLDLVATKMLVRDGAMWKLVWTAPAAPEGHDGARVVFALPPAPTEPRLASPELAATTLVTLRRDSEKDELELVRAHVPRGEAVTWSARVDPKAFPLVVAPELRPPAAKVLSAPAPTRAPIIVALGALVALGVALGFALRTKQRAVTYACAEMSSRARPLVPLGARLSPVAYGASTVAALAALLWTAPAYGGTLIVIAMALAAHRTPALVTKPRGPGQWQPIADEEVLVARASEPAPGDSLDIGTRRGKAVASLLLAAIASLAFVLRSRVPGAAVAIPLTGAALVPLFVTGTRAQLPRRPAELAARVLAPARDILGRIVDLAHVELQCRARFMSGTRAYDEVRLACTPVDRLPGLRTIELALASLEPGALAALPEILVRFDDGSAAAAKIAQVAPGARVVPGRTPEEKVLRLSPRSPTPSGAARLLARLTAELEGRRASDRAPTSTCARETRQAPRWTGIERRVARATPAPLAAAVASA